MVALSVQRQRLAPEYGRDGEGCVEVWKFCAAAGHFPLQRRAEAIGIDGSNDQVGATGEMLGERAAGLFGR